MSARASSTHTSSNEEAPCDHSPRNASQAANVNSATSAERAPEPSKRTNRNSQRYSTSTAASDSSPTPSSSNQPVQGGAENNQAIQVSRGPKSRSNGAKSKRAHRGPHDPSRAPSSPASSGFSSAMSDTSAHSTSGTSSPYATGSVFVSHRLSPSDIKYRDEKPKVLRTYIVGKLIGEGTRRR